jgi:serine/threonine-protein kinase
MPLPRALHVALQLCDAAGEAHAQGIVHRDVKPENVMLVKRSDDPDYVKVLDFGIARLNWGEQSMATAAGLIFGTARYISPEGAQGEKVGPQGDVYSIATMVYQMLSGRTPFDADQAVALLVQQIHDAPPPLKSIPRASYVPDPIASVVMENLAKKASDRADHARALGRALLEAAVSSGLSAQDILARPSMMSGARGQHASAVQMPSMNRTNKLQLEPDVASRIDAARPPKTAYETPAPSAAPPAEGRTQVRTEIAEPTSLPPGSATSKWAPPAGFEARLVPPPPPLVPPPPPSGIDATMDDQSPPTPPPSRTAVLATPAPALVAVPTKLPKTMAEGVTVPPAHRGDTAPPLSRTAPPSSRPSSSVDSTLAGDESPDPLPRTRARSLMLVVVCFLVGAIGMGVIASRAGLLGGRAQAAQLDAQLARANDALQHRRWDAPPGNNVKDLTDQGLSRWPNDPQLLAIRARACDDAVAAARARRDQGDASEALRLAQLASQLDPNDAAARSLVAELTAPPPAPVEPAIPPLAPTRTSPSGAMASVGGTRAVVDVSNAKPGMGQPVDFSARIVGPHARVEGAVFRVSGPGIGAGTTLDATDDGSGVYRTTFTFLQSGRFEVSFGARADGAALRSGRVVVVGDVKPLPPAVPATDGPPPLPVPSSSAKWL